MRYPVISFLLAALAWPAHAAPEHGSEAEAQDMVRRAQNLIKAIGPERAYKVFTDNPGADFRDRDLYVFVYDFSGNMLAQGMNSKLVGKNLMELRDADGNLVAKGLIDMVKEKHKGWYGPYRWSVPGTKEYAIKKSYCERGEGDTLICVGVYSELVKHQ
ncbi:MAG: cache domain-containing protein [Pseudomonadota bacterium]